MNEAKRRSEDHSSWLIEEARILFEAHRRYLEREHGDQGMVLTRLVDNRQDFDVLVLQRDRHGGEDSFLAMSAVEEILGDWLKGRYGREPKVLEDRLGHVR